MTGFSDQELDIIHEMLSARYDDYKNKLKQEGAVRNGGLTPQQRLCQDIAERISSLANGCLRNREQVKDRIKYELAKIRTYLSTERTNQLATGGGKRKRVTEPPAALECLIAEMRREVSASGITGIEETHQPAEAVNVTSGIDSFCAETKRTRREIKHNPHVEDVDVMASDDEYGGRQFRENRSAYPKDDMYQGAEEPIKYEEEVDVKVSLRPNVNSYRRLSKQMKAQAVYNSVADKRSILMDIEIENAKMKKQVLALQMEAAHWEVQFQRQRAEGSRVYVKKSFTSSMVRASSH